MATFSEMINGDKPVLVDFFATWCGPCKTMAPILEDVKKKIGESASIIKVDVDTNFEASAKYAIKGVPTLILFKNGKILWRTSGIVPGHLIEQAIRQNL